MLTVPLSRFEQASRRPSLEMSIRLFESRAAVACVPSPISTLATISRWRDRSVIERKVIVRRSLESRPESVAVTLSEVINPSQAEAEAGDWLRSCPRGRLRSQSPALSTGHRLQH